MYEAAEQGEDLSGYLTVFGPSVSFALLVTDVDTSYGSLVTV